MICSSRLATLVLGFMLVTGGAAAQEQFVTVCGRDDAPGGLNHLFSGQDQGIQLPVRL